MQRGRSVEKNRYICNSVFIDNVAGYNSCQPPPTHTKALCPIILSITKYKPTFVSLGNHDQMTHAEDGIWIPGNVDLLRETIEEIPNFHLISNGEKCDMNYLNISACSPGFDYYE